MLSRRECGVEILPNDLKIQLYKVQLPLQLGTTERTDSHNLVERDKGENGCLHVSVDQVVNLAFGLVTVNLYSSRKKLTLAWQYVLVSRWRFLN